MKTLIVLLLLYLSFSSLRAQFIIDLSHLDYIETSEYNLDGYVKRGDDYIKYCYKGYDLDSDSLIISEEDEYSEIYDDVIKVSDIPKMSIADWEKSLASMI